MWTRARKASAAQPIDPGHCGRVAFPAPATMKGGIGIRVVSWSGDRDGPFCRSLRCVGRRVR